MMSPSNFGGNYGAKIKRESETEKQFFAPLARASLMGVET
jgi:hypothetical protein